MKKITSIILSVVLILNIFCTLGITVSAEISGNYQYYISDNNATITDYYGSATELIIPSQLDGYTVTRIDSYAFNGCTSLKRVTIPDSVTSIGYGNDMGIGTFYGCTSLKSITIPDSVTSICNNAFSNTAYYNNKDNWENGVLYVGKHLIKADKSIQGECKIKEGTLTIADNAFGYCTNLTSITVPDSVTSIGVSVFYGCSSLTSISIPNSVSQIKGNALRDCTALTSITVPDSVTSIGGSAFSGCSSLTSISIPNSVTKIESYAFYECNKLEYAYYEGYKNNLTIENNNTSLENVIQYKGYKETINNFSYDYFDGKLIISGYGEMSFENSQTVPWDSFISAIKSVEIKDGITSIGANAFNGCTNLSEITIPNSVTRIANNAFTDCSNLTSITIPSQVTRIEYGTFSGCSSLGSITIPDYVTSIGNKAFSDCTNLTSITIPSKVTSIGSSAFYRCAKLKDISISNTTSYIGMQAFYNCSSLESISIPDGVTKIYDGTFSGCNNLNYAFYNGYKSNLAIGTYNEPLTKVIKYTKDKGTFNGGEWYFDYTTGVLRITGNGNMEFGNSHTIPWSEYKNDIKSVVIESGITSIADYAFTFCTNLSSVTIPNTVTYIGESAFEGCEALMSLSIPRNVSYIAKDAFYGCKKIQTVNLGNNVFIGDGAFTDCTSLKNVYLSSSVSAIGDNAFSNCTSLENITIPQCDNPLGQSAFSYCVNLKTVEIKNGLPGIESSAFYGCSSLKTISIPDSVKSIGEEAFSDCQNLTSVTIGAGCKSISSKAFWDCPKLNKITVKYPNCIFDNSQYTISTTAVICGYKNSTAYTYARSYMRSFEDIETGIKYGWIDGSFIELPTEIDPTNPTEPISSESWVVVKAPTCDESGVEVNYAAQKSRIVPALGHDYSNEFTIDKVATCTENGLKSKHCSRCDSTTEKTIIPKTSHRPSSEWIVVKEATTTEEGLEEKHCLDCGAVLDSRTIPLLPQLILGDVDGDGVVTIIDATCIQRHIAELATVSYNEIAADADGDGEVTILDATGIQRYLAELPCFAGIGNPIS